MLVSASACSGSNGSTEGEASAQRATVTGSILLTWTSWDGPLEGPGCYGTTGYDDVREGAQVVVADGTGATLALGSLGPGTAGMVDGQRQCKFSFSVPAVPTDKSFYRLKIGQRDAPQYSAATLFGGDLQLTLGENPPSAASQSPQTPEDTETTPDGQYTYGDSATIGSWKITVSQPVETAKPENLGFCGDDVSSFAAVRVEWTNLSKETLVPGDTVVVRGADGAWPAPVCNAESQGDVVFGFSAWEPGETKSSTYVYGLDPGVTPSDLAIGVTDPDSSEDTGLVIWTS